MPLDDLALKLATLEALLTSITERFDRLEVAFERFTLLDRSVAEMSIRYEQTQRDLRDLAHEIKNVAQNDKTSTDVLMLKTDGAEKARTAFENKTAGVLLTLKLFSGVCASLLLVCGGWVYTRIDANRIDNLEQARDIKELRDRLDRLERNRPTTTDRSAS